MNFQKHIKNATYHIEQLQKRIPLIKNQTHLNKHVEMINAFIQLINCIEFVADNKLQYQTIDKLLLARMRTNLRYYEGQPKQFGYWDIKFLVDRINFDLSFSKELLMQQVVNQLTGLDLTMHLEQIPKKPRKGSILPDIDNSKISSEELNIVADGIKDLTPAAEYEQRIERLLTEFKTQLTWN